jgi:phage terminase large subunit-like protein
MSQLIDASIRDQPEDVLTIVFETPEEYDIDDEEGWIYSNPGLDVFRSRDDLRSQAESAKRIPAQASRFSNLCLNRRTSADTVWLAPDIYKANGGPVDMNVFRENGCVVGLDLSRVNDLCCAAIAAKDPESGLIHLKVYTFSPADGLEERSRRDRVPYDVWRDQGHIFAPPGRTLDYDMVAGWLAQELEREGIVVNQVCFDRWGAAAFFAACDRVGFAVNAIREEVGQGYVSISPRIQAMETALLQEKIRHGNDQPVLALGASSAIVVQDPALNRKLDKTKASNKIDALMASLFAVYPLISGTEEEPVDMSWALTLEPETYHGGFGQWR